MFGDGTDMPVRILESDGGIKGNLFALDDIYDQIYFIPLIQEVQIQGLLLVKQEKALTAYMGGEAVVKGIVKEKAIWFLEEREVRVAIL